jgi:ketopantoate reductase
MRIAVLATGAVGGYFGARLAAAGHDVFFIARGANREAIRSRGLKVDSVLGDLLVMIGRAKGIALPEDFAGDRLKFGETSPPTLKASMLHDLERGNRLELDWLSGHVVKLGCELGVATPANEAVYKVLKLHRMGAVGA